MEDEAAAPLERGEKYTAPAVLSRAQVTGRVESDYSYTASRREKPGLESSPAYPMLFVRLDRRALSESNSATELSSLSFQGK